MLASLQTIRRSRADRVPRTGATASTGPAHATSDRARSPSAAPSASSGIAIAVVLGVVLVAIDAPPIARVDRPPPVVGRAHQPRAGAPQVLCRRSPIAGIRSVAGSDATETVANAADLAADRAAARRHGGLLRRHRRRHHGGLRPAAGLKAVRSSQRSTRPRRPTQRSFVPTTVPEVAFSDQRLDNGLRVDRRRGPPRSGRRGQPLVRRRLQARGPGQDRLRPPLRARHVPGLAPRRQGRAHRARPGRRRDDERLDLARPDELLRDAAGAPARAGAVARGRPDGDAARRAQPGEPRQPARGRQEREALVVRQPAVRLVPGEAPGPPLPARSTRTTTRRSARWTTSTPPRSRTSAPSSGPITRRTTRSCRSSATSRRPTSCAAAERYFGGDPAEPGHPAARRPDAAADARRRAARGRSTTRCRCRASTSASARPVFGDPRLDALDLAGQILSGGKGSRLNRRLVRDERIAQDVAIFTLGFIGGASVTAGWATVRPGVPVDAGRGGPPRGARPAGDGARQRRRAGPGQGADRVRRAGRPPARRGAGRPAVDVRDAVRRPGADQPDAAALPGGDPRGDPRRRGGRLPARQPAGPDLPARGHDRGRRRALARGRRSRRDRTDEEVAA